jgi:hypothetical protein
MITLVLAEMALSVGPMPQRGSKVLMLKSLNSQNSHKGKMLNTEAKKLAKRGFKIQNGRQRESWIWCKERLLKNPYNWELIDATSIKACMFECEKPDNDPKRSSRCLSKE